jgi:hypothetical protein
MQNIVALIAECVDAGSSSTLLGAFFFAALSLAPLILVAAFPG